MTDRPARPSATRPSAARPRAARRAPLLVALALAAGAAGCAAQPDAAPPGAGAQAERSAAPVVVRTGRATLEVATFASGLEFPWGLAFLPDGRMLVTERPGRLRIVDAAGAVSEPVQGVPEVQAGGQGGLLDVAVSPRFAGDRTVFLSYVEPTASGARTAVARGVLDGGALRELRVIFRQQPDPSGRHHFGSRLAFDHDGNLFVTLGDRFSYRDRAQDLGSTIGKIVRLRPDGTVPPDNPFVGRAGALPEIWSYGHRNVQGAAIHPRTGELWAHEHGPQGGDELNAVARGGDHGWPVVTFGREYGSGLKIGEGSERAGVVAPLVQWTPSIGPSGLAFYRGDRIPGWKDSALVGALVHRGVYRLQLDGRKVVSQERLLESLGHRIRDVRVSPDGYVWLLTDSPEGRILKVGPGSGR